MSKKQERISTITGSGEMREGTERQRLIEALGFLLARQYLKDLSISQIARDRKSSSSQEDTPAAFVSKMM